MEFIIMINSVFIFNKFQFIGMCICIKLYRSCHWKWSCILS